MAKSIRSRILSRSIILLVIGIVSLILNIYYEHKGYKSVPPYIVAYIANASYIVTGVLGLLVLKNMRFLEAFIVALGITIVLKIVVLIWILTDFDSTRFILTIIGTVVAVSGRSDYLGDFVH